MVLLWNAFQSQIFTSFFVLNELVSGIIFPYYTPYYPLYVKMSVSAQSINISRGVQPFRPPTTQLWQTEQLKKIKCKFKKQEIKTTNKAALMFLTKTTVERLRNNKKMSTTRLSHSAFLQIPVLDSRIRRAKRFNGHRDAESELLISVCFISRWNIFYFKQFLI